MTKPHRPTQEATASGRTDVPLPSARSDHPDFDVRSSAMSARLAPFTAPHGFGSVVLLRRTRPD